MCDRIVVISKGKIVADAKTDELSAQVSGGQKLSLTAEGNTADITEAIKKIPAVKRVTKTGSNADGSGKYMIEYETSSDIRRDVYNAMVRVGAVILDMQSGNETLEDMFLKLTSVIIFYFTICIIYISRFSYCLWSFAAVPVCSQY